MKCVSSSTATKIFDAATTATPLTYVETNTNTGGVNVQPVGKGNIAWTKDGVVLRIISFLSLMLLALKNA